MAVLKFLTVLLMSLPKLANIFKSICNIISEAIDEYERKQLQKKIEAATEKAKKTGCTDDLEKLLGKKG